MPGQEESAERIVRRQNRCCAKGSLFALPEDEGDELLTNPLVSVVLTNYNGEKYVGKAIESVLSQTYSNWELIIVDDASTDDSLSVLHQYQDPRIRILELPENSQVSYGHNTGNAVARGAYIAAIDNDDVWHEEKLEKQVRYMEEHPEAGVCFTLLDLIDEEGRPTEDDMELSIFEVENRSREAWLHELLTQGNHFANNASLIRTSVMREIGENDLCLLQLHDLDMWLKIPQIAEMYILQEPLVHYRRFVGSGSISQPSERNTNRTFFEYSYLIGNTVLNLADDLFLRVFQEELVNRTAATPLDVKCEKALLLMSDQLNTNVKSYAYDLFHELFASEEGRACLKEKYGITQHQVYALTGDPIFYDEQFRLKMSELELKNRHLQKPLSRRVQKVLRRYQWKGLRKAETVRKTFAKKARRMLNPLTREAGTQAAGASKQEKNVLSHERTVSLLVFLQNPSLPFLQEMIRSVLEQTYPNWELILAEGRDAEHPDAVESCCTSQNDPRIHYLKLEKNLGFSDTLKACLAAATGEYIALLGQEDLLCPETLADVMQAICREQAEYLYTDEAVFSGNREQILRKQYKPDYACDKLLSGDYIGHLSVVSRELVDRAGVFRSESEGCPAYEMTLRLTDAAERIAHIPKVLYLRRSQAGTTGTDTAKAGKKAVHAFLKEKKGISAVVDSVPAYPDRYHIYYPLARTFSVDVIMDVADPGRLDLLREDLSALTLYPNFRIRFVTGQPSAWKMKGYGGNASLLVLEGRTRAERMAEAARESSADFLLFLEEGTMPLSPGWMKEMLILAAQPHIGAVGGKICLWDETIRHAGLILGMGKRGLIGRRAVHAPRGYAGQNGQLAIVTDVSAVSSECMMIRRERYLEAGGFSASYQDVLFDADLCLRLGQLGYRQVYTPFAELEETARRKVTLDYGEEWPHYLQDAKVFREKWHTEMEQGDPFYHPHLSLKHEDYSLQ